MLKLAPGSPLCSRSVGFCFGLHVCIPVLTQAPGLSSLVSLSYCKWHHGRSLCEGLIPQRGLSPEDFPGRGVALWPVDLILWLHPHLLHFLSVSPSAQPPIFILKRNLVEIYIHVFLLFLCLHLFYDAQVCHQKQLQTYKRNGVGFL